MTMPTAPGTPSLPADYAGPPIHAASAPPAVPPAAAPAPPAAPPAAVAPVVEPAPPAAVVRGRGGEPMDDEAIAERVKREKKKALKDAWGTDDETQIVAIKAKRDADAADLAKLKADKEKADRDQMTEVQRLTTDLEAANKEIEQLKLQIATKDKEVMSSKQEAVLAGRMTAFKFSPKPSVQRAVKLALADHFNALSKTNQAVFVKTGGLDKWLKDFAKENPEFLSAAPAVVTETPVARPAAAPRAPVRVPVGGARPAAPPRVVATTTTVDPLEGKTPLPGRSNSMTPTELKQYMARGKNAAAG